MARTIYFTADDLGWNESTNLAIEHAHQQGILNAAGLMLGQPGTAHALAIAARNPGLRIGCHFHACDSQPLTRTRWPWGRSAVRAGILIGLWPGARTLVRRELAAQWTQFLATGLKCDFINGHHHLHVHPFVARELHRLTTGTFNGWVRSLHARFFDQPERGNWMFRWLERRSVKWLSTWPAQHQTDTLWGIDRTFRMQADEIVRALPTLPDGFHEFIFHPRQIGDADHRALVELKRRLTRI